MSAGWVFVGFAGACLIDAGDITRGSMFMLLAACVAAYSIGAARWDGKAAQVGERE